MKKVIRKNEAKGFALLMVLIILAVVSLLGTTILTVTSNEFQASHKDFQSQSAFYVAESGVHFTIADMEVKLETLHDENATQGAFFQAFEDMFTASPYLYQEFEENFGEEPEARITVALENSDANTRTYRIESMGRIGKMERTVSSTISLKFETVSVNPIIDDLLFYTKNFSFEGTSINGDQGTVVTDGIDGSELNGGSRINISTMYFNGPVDMDGGSASLGNQAYPGTLYVNGDLNLWSGRRDVYGDIRVKGDFSLKDADIHGDVYVEGNLILGWTPDIRKNIYYTGTLTAPNGYPQTLLAKCVKVSSVDSWDVPMREIELRDDAWFLSKGYELKGNVKETVPDHARWVVEDYNYTKWPRYDVNGDGIFEDVVIISKGDITINTASRFSGVLIAPNGTVSLPQGGTTFEGVIISQDGISGTGGGSNFYLKKIQEYFSPEDLPVLFMIPGGEGSDEGGSQGSGQGGYELEIIADFIEE